MAIHVASPLAGWAAVEPEPMPEPTRCAAPRLAKVKAEPVSEAVWTEPWLRCCAATECPHGEGYHQVADGCEQSRMRHARRKRLIARMGFDPFSVFDRRRDRRLRADRQWAYHRANPVKRSKRGRAWR